MILSKKNLRIWERSFLVSPTKLQRRRILKRFGSEPGYGHIWTEQDIYTQLHNFISKGCWD